MKNARLVRLNRKFSLTQVYRETGITPSGLSKFERGKRQHMSYPLLKRLADCYGCTIDHLLLDVAEDAEASPPTDDDLTPMG